MLKKSQAGAARAASAASAGCSAYAAWRGPGWASQFLPKACSAGGVYNPAMRRRIIKSVLHNFLGTYTSRYTDHGGYWLFGFVVDEPGELEFDLLDDSQAMNAVVSVAATIAAQRFREQLKKAGLSPAIVRTAKLTIKKRSDRADGYVNGHLCQGYVLEFQARVSSDLGREFRSEAHIFAAPHNAQFECKSSRQWLGVEP